MSESSTMRLDDTSCYNGYHFIASQPLPANSAWPGYRIRFRDVAAKGNNPKGEKKKEKKDSQQKSCIRFDQILAQIKTEAALQTYSIQGCGQPLNSGSSICTGKRIHHFYSESRLEQTSTGRRLRTKPMEGPQRMLLLSLVTFCSLTQRTFAR